MNTTLLQQYLLKHLPEPADEEQAKYFFDQSNVADWLAGAEAELTQAFLSRWQAAHPPVAEAAPPIVEQSRPEVAVVAPTQPESAMAEQAQNESATLLELPAEVPPEVATPYLFQVPDDELPAPADAPAAEPDSQSVSSIHNIATISEPTPDPVRFTPTQQPAPPAPQPQRTLSIPNATVGKPYSHAVDFEGLGLTGITTHTLTGDAAGLTYDEPTQTLAGTPTEAGEFGFTLTYHLKTDEPNRPALTRHIQLLVNPDPRSLWKDLPSDATDPYFKPDADQKLVVAEAVRLLAASVRGRSHAHEGKFRDDEFDLTPFAETNWYLLSVADGAGSAKYSRRGATLACVTVRQQLQGMVGRPGWLDLDAAIDQYAADGLEQTAALVQRKLYDVLGNAIFGAYKAIESEAQTHAAETKDYATTLISVLARPTKTGWFVGGFWVGDGGVGIYRAGQDPIILGTPDGGEYAGQTRFLTMSDTISTNFFARFRFSLVDRFDAIVLMTDGVTDPKFQTDSNLNRADKWAELWAELTQAVTFADDEQAPSQLQEWLTFWSPGNHDDRTIALLYTHADHPKN